MGQISYLHFGRVLLLQKGKPGPGQSEAGNHPGARCKKFRGDLFEGGACRVHVIEKKDRSPFDTLRSSHTESAPQILPSIRLGRGTLGQGMTNPFNRVEIQGNAETHRQGSGQEDALVELPFAEAFGMEGTGRMLWKASAGKNRR